MTDMWKRAHVSCLKQAEVRWKKTREKDIFKYIQLKRTSKPKSRPPRHISVHPRGTSVTYELGWVPTQQRKVLWKTYFGTQRQYRCFWRSFLLMSGVAPSCSVLLNSVVQVSVEIQWILQRQGHPYELLLLLLSSLWSSSAWNMGVGDHCPSDRIPSLFDWLLSLFQGKHFRPTFSKRSTPTRHFSPCKSLRRVDRFHIV